MPHRTSKTVTLWMSVLATAAVMATACALGHHADDREPDIHSAPHHLRWVAFRGVEVPEADEGPHRVEGPVASGYDLTPAAAAIAAIEASIRISVADDSQWPQVGQRMVNPGSGRDSWATARAQITITDPVDTAFAPRVLGYSITNYAPTRAEVAVYLRQVDGSLTRNVATVVRRDDDWLLDLPAHTAVPSVSVVTETPPGLVVLSAAHHGAER